MLLQVFLIEFKFHVLKGNHFEMLLALQSCIVIWLEPVAQVGSLQVWKLDYK